MYTFRAAQYSVIWVFMLLSATAVLHAQQKSAASSPIAVRRRPGREDGPAQMLVGGKLRKITPHAVAAFLVRGGQGALIIVRQPPKRNFPRQYILRYYDLDSGRRRVLGTVPFASGSVVETKTSDERWAFALGGIDHATGKPVVIVGDDQAIPGLLPNSSAPDFHEVSQNETTLTYTQAGEAKSARLGILVGTELHSIYMPPHTTQTSLSYIQVFPNGQAITDQKDGSLRKRRWSTDGANVTLFDDSKTSETVPISSLRAIKGVPAGARFGVRLTQELSSVKTHKGYLVKAVSITPVVVDGEILIPASSAIEGTVVEANGVGWGFKHETASMTIHWIKATTPDGHVLDLDARVFAAENAQEKVNAKGRIQGIRSTATIGHSVENGVLTFAGIDPMAYIFASASGSAVLGFAEPEILYPSGTELILEIAKPLITADVYSPSVMPAAGNAEAQEQLQKFVKRLSFRTRTKGSNKVSDLTNLVFIGSPLALQRAFAAAGWLPTDDLHAGSTFRTVKTLTGNQTYTQDPMSVLLLDERAPLFTWSKTTNTFSSRHHLRVFPTEQLYGGETVLTSSSTQDIGIAFSKKQKTFIHVIDQHIDNERSKVVNNLMYTGCVESLDMVKRPWVPRDAYNSTGDRLLTDGDVAVVHINSCTSRRATSFTLALPPNRFERSTRNTSLTIRNGLYRGNLVYQGISGALKVRHYLRSASEVAADTGSWRKTDESGADYKGFGSNPGLQKRSRDAHGGSSPSPEDTRAIEKARESHKWDPPRYEFALEGGYMHMRTDFLSGVGVIEESSVATNPTYFLFLGDQVGDGWAAGGSVTVNSWKHFSNEFSYFREQVKYELGTVAVTIPPGQNIILDDSDLDTFRIGLVTRQFEYNLLMHPTRPTSRWRPYAAVGPVLQLVSLNGAPLKKPAGVYTLGLKNIGLIKAAFDFGNTPPLDGGGIFHIGLQYGAGIKYRVTPRMTLRADWRETWSKNPDIIANSYEDYDSNALDETYTTEVTKIKQDQKFIQDRYTVGVAFTF